MRLASWRQAVIAALVGAFALGIAGSAQAATFDVNTTADSGDGTCDAVPGGCTLRDAVQGANASSDADVAINVPAGHYVLTDGQLSFFPCEGGADTVTVNGAGARDVIVDGNGESRVFAIYCGDVTLRNLTVTGGVSDIGGGIFNDDVLTLDHVAVSDNRAEGNCLFGAQITCFAISGLGGGIFSTWVLSATNSVVDHNVAASGLFFGGAGGGIYDGGDSALTNVTISDNSAEEGLALPITDGGPAASLFPASGGGIFLAGFGLELVDSTVSRHSRGAITANTALTNVTLSNNSAGIGGGISSESLLNTAEARLIDLPQMASFQNTIVANNSASDDSILRSARATDGSDNCFSFAGQFVSAGNNLESDTSCGFTAGGDKQNADPLLGDLADNGGQTNTRALGDGSPALDSAAPAPACPPTDQRDVSRPQGPACDIGAYEKEVPVPVPATATSTGAAGTQAAKKLTAKASIKGPRRCTRTTATVRVSGQNIATVTYSLDGKKVKKAKGDKTSVKVNARHLKSGVHRITAKITFDSATAAKSQTKRISFSRCARKAARPKFTG